MENSLIRTSRLGLKKLLGDQEAEIEVLSSYERLLAAREQIDAFEETLLPGAREADARYDLRFINAMIEHHTGALTMAQDALNKSRRPEI